MVRKRGVARTSFARRRVRRVKKYDHHVIPLRFKVQLLDFAERLEPKLYVHVECEVPTMELLGNLGVPTEEWVYYLGFMKRMVKLYRNFTSETLQKEKDSLISEYVLRGKDITVLEQVQEVAANCAEGIFELPFTCVDVKACLEGDYTAWSEIWEYSFGVNVNIVGACFQGDFLYIIYRDYGVNRNRILILKLSDGSVQFQSGAVNHYFKTNYFDDYDHARYNVLAWMDGSLVFSILGKYTLIGRYEPSTGNTEWFEVWKNGSLQWTSPLASVAVVGASEFYEAGLRHDGKYIVALTDNNVLVCFQAS